MRHGDLFESDGRVFRFDSWHYTQEGKAGAYTAKCMTPKKGEGPWWSFEVDPEDLPAAVTRH